MNHKDKDTFYKHKEGKCHYTIYEIEKQIISYPVKKYKNGKTKVDKSKKKVEKFFAFDIPIDKINSIMEEMQRANEKRIYSLECTRYKFETSPEELVIKNFLVIRNGRTKVWHKDGDESNNWYKNLLTVTPKDYKDLKAGKVTWQELNLEQEYIEYENKASYQAYMIYNGIKARCKDTKNNENVRACYDKSTMCQEWLEEPKTFVKWYLEHYYKVDEEEMDVDKDLFGDGSGMYHPDFCCILPKGLNAMLANSKKHYKGGETPENVLPLGVRYNGKLNKYYSEITFADTRKSITLSYWNTPEEAFAEYKLMKKADILRMVAMYKEKVPHYVYNALLKVEVKPY